MQKERRNRFCPNGHDTKVLGVRPDNSCSECRRTRNRNAYKKNPYVKREANMKYWRLKRYGLSDEEYQKLRVDQKVCSICNRPSERTLHVDHNHLTDKVRGLLCFKCNAMLGLAEDNCDTLFAAIKYLNNKL